MVNGNHCVHSPETFRLHGHSRSHGGASSSLCVSYPGQHSQAFLSTKVPCTLLETGARTKLFRSERIRSNAVVPARSSRMVEAKDLVYSISCLT